MKWDGVERRMSNQDTLERIERTIDAHIESDNRSFSELSNRLNSIDNNFGKLIAILESTQKGISESIIEMNKKIAEHNLILNGNHNTKGMNTRLEILESQEESRKWTFRVMWGAIITLLVKTFYGFLERR